MRTVAAAIGGLDAPLAPGCNSLGRMLADLDSHQCCFPLRGQGAATRFCAVEIAPGEWMPGACGGSYCRFHRIVSRGRGSEAERDALEILLRRG